MKKSKLVLAVILLGTAATAANAADLRLHHLRYHAHRAYGLPYPISYLHNYGPGPEPGTFAYYDGPSSNFCYRGSAAYLGQDHRRHPCF
jgi:hypothetical protein